MSAHTHDLTDSPFGGNTNYHVVNKDETVSGIAQRYGAKVEDLAVANKLTEPYSIKEGSRLIVPKQAPEKAMPVSRDEPSPLEHENSPDSELSWPIAGNVIKEFGNGDEVHRNGITIEGHEGGNVKAAGSGKVGHVGDIPGLGKVVLIDHSDRLVSVYAQLNETLVSVGDSVTRSQIIGSLGGAGQKVKPTLYFEVRSHAKATNPVKFLKTKHQ